MLVPAPATGASAPDAVGQFAHPAQTSGPVRADEDGSAAAGPSSGSARIAVGAAPAGDAIGVAAPAGASGRDDRVATVEVTAASWSDRPPSDGAVATPVVPRDPDQVPVLPHVAAGPAAHLASAAIARPESVAIARATTMPRTVRSAGPGIDDGSNGRHGTTPGDVAGNGAPVGRTIPVGSPEAPANGSPRPVPSPRGPMPDGRPGCTAAQLRRFIKSRAYVPLHELRRRFELDGDEDDVSPIDLDGHRLFVGLPDREAALLRELLDAGDVGYELLLDPASPLVVGVFPMRPVPRA